MRSKKYLALLLVVTDRRQIRSIVKSNKAKLV